MVAGIPCIYMTRAPTVTYATTKNVQQLWEWRQFRNASDILYSERKSVR